MAFRSISKLLHYGKFSAGWLNSKTYASAVDNYVDVLISGGGMVGASMACALGHDPIFEGKRIVLLESAPKTEFNLSEEYCIRTCALNQGTVSLLNSFKAWAEVEKMRYQPVKGMQVWDSCSESLITFNREQLLEDLAYIVENDVILAAINKQLENLKTSIDVRYNSHAQNFVFPSSEDSESSLVEVHLNNGDILHTKLLIGADGMNSSVRKAAKFHTISWSYKQFAVVAILKLAEIENTVAWQRFLPTGPIAMLPLSNEYSSLIWTTTKESAENLLSLSEESFVDAVNDALWHDRDKSTVAVDIGNTFEKILRNVIPGGSSTRQLPPTVIGIQEKSRAKFPLGLMHSSEYIKPRVALIGDAAHRIHPLAGQGVNLGFGDVACLRDVLKTAVSNGSDIGSMTYLSEYETSRQRHVLPVAATIDGLQRLYNTSFLPVVILRSLGLQTTNALTFVKDKIISQAMK